MVAATFRVRADAAAADRAREFLRRRRETQPLAERSVGCVFRNPGPGVRSAGALIDAAGLKGTRCGGGGFPAHANFLVYRRRERDDEDDEDDVGPASGGASEFDALIRRVKRAVFDATGVELREEVRRVPLTFEPAPIANEADRIAGGAETEAEMTSRDSLSIVYVLSTPSPRRGRDGVVFRATLRD